MKSRKLLAALLGAGILIAAAFGTWASGTAAPQRRRTCPG